MFFWNLKKHKICILEHCPACPKFWDLPLLYVCDLYTNVRLWRWLLLLFYDQFLPLSDALIWMSLQNIILCKLHGVVLQGSDWQTVIQENVRNRKIFFRLWALKFVGAPFRRTDGTLISVAERASINLTL